MRDLEISDLVDLEKNNKIPNLYNGQFRLMKAIEQDNELIGSCWVRLTTESTIIFKENLNNLTIARALKEVNKFLHCEVPKLGINDSYALFEESPNEEYIRLLKKHFNFIELPKALRYIGCLKEI